jgi:PAS domain S-box-containing protein
VVLTGSKQHRPMPEPDRAPTGDSEIRETVVLRRAMRDLLALCTIPAAWVGREPDAIAKGVVDVLIAALRVECGYLVLGGDPAEIQVMQGVAPPEVIEALLLKCSGELPRAPVVHDLCQGYRAAIAPIRVASKSGFVAAISSRPGFPTETESMLMSVAANQAAISLEEAHLLQERIRAERALRESEVFNRTIIETSPDCIKVLSSDGTLVYLNAGGQKMLECEANDLVGACWTDLWHGSDHDTAVRALETAKSGSTAHMQGFCPTAKGTPKWWDVVVTPIYDSEQRVERLLCISRDITQQRKAQEELEESAKREALLRAEADLERKRLQEIMAQAPAAMGLLNGPEHRWSYVNQHYVRVTGRNSPSDFIGKTLEESLPESETQVFRKLLDEVYRTGEPYFGQEMKVTLNRMEQPSEVYFDFVYQPVRNSAGQVEDILVHAVEVTGKVLAGKIIAESEERLRLAQGAAQIGTWEWDAVNGTSRLSPELHRIFASDANDPRHAQVWAERVHPEDAERVQQLMQKGYAEGEMEFEYRYQNPRTGTRWLYCKGRRGEGESRMLGVVQDVTERNAAEEARRRLAAIVESSDDAIVSKDLNGIVTSWNACAEKTFGYTAEEIVGKPITTIIPPELQDDERRILATIARGERIEHFETVRMKKNGDRIDVSLTISPIKDEDGRVLGAAKIARDITQRKRTERALQLTEKLASVGRLAATVAHELNNPLEAVTNFIFLAQTTENLPEIAKEYLTLADRELERVSHIAQQTLGFYRDTSAATVVDIRESLDDVLRIFESKLRYKSINVDVSAERGLKIEALGGEVRQVFSNLISNAIDASPSHGVIKVHAKTVSKQSESYAQITFADVGSGIPDRLKSSIFNPFFTTKSDVGTGLGLWVSKSLVEKHRGRIAFRTQRGKGTVFTVQFPLRASHHQKEHQRATA